MELILLILKIILIAFLVVLGLIVLLLGLVLFVPIHYEVSGSIGDSWDIKVQGKITYLLSVIKLLFLYEKEQFDMKFFLFGFEKKTKEEQITETVESESEVTFHEKAENDVEAEKPKTAEAVETGAKTEEVTVEVSEPASEKETEPEVKKEQAKAKKQKEKKQKSKIDFAFIKQQLTDEHNKSVVHKIWTELLYLFKHFKFRKIVTDLRFSTGDPATTGQALGVLCMFPVLYRYEVKIVPDFESDDLYLKGTFLVAGKVRLIHLLITALRLIFDKEVRLVVKRIIALFEK